MKKLSLANRVVNEWSCGGYDDVKKELLKDDSFRAELKRHGIGIRTFSRYGNITSTYHQDRKMHVLMGKYQGIYDYLICIITDDGINSDLPPTTREKLMAAAEEWNDEEHAVKVCRKYFYVCRNNGAHHRGNAGHLGGYATFIGKFNADGERVDPLS